MNIEKINAIIMARVSSKDQLNGFSTEAQMKDVIMPALKMHEQINKKKFIILQKFELAETASKKKSREEFEKVVEILKANPGCWIIYEKEDRWGRNTDDMNLWFNLMHEYDITFWGIKSVPPVHKNSPAPQKFMTLQLLAMATFYSWNLSDEVKKGMKRKVLNGGLLGFASPGYKNATIKNDDGTEKKTWVPSDDLKIVKAIWDYADMKKCSFTALRDFAQKQGLTTPRGKPIDRTSIRNLIKNPIYYGYQKSIHVEGGLKRVEDIEPIITKEKWDRVNEHFSSRNTSHVIGKRRLISLFSFARISHCNICGCKITGVVRDSRNNGQYKYYACNHGRDEARVAEGKGACGLPLIPVRMAEETASKTISNFQYDKEQKEAIKLTLDKLTVERKKELTNRLRGMKVRYAKTQARLEDRFSHLEKSKKDSKVAYDFFMKMYKPTLNEQGKLEGNIKDLEKELSTISNFTQEHMRILETTANLKKNWEKFQPIQKQEILRVITDDVIFKMDKTVEIKWSQPFGNLFAFNHRETNLGSMYNCIKKQKAGFFEKLIRKIEKLETIVSNPSLNPA